MSKCPDILKVVWVVVLLLLLIWRWCNTSSWRKGTCPQSGLSVSVLLLLLLLLLTNYTWRPSSELSGHDGRDCCYAYQTIENSSDISTATLLQPTVWGLR